MTDPLPLPEAVAWPPLARDSEDYVLLDGGRECLPMTGRGESTSVTDEKGTWNRAIEECQRAVSMARGIGRERAYPLARWLTVHFRDRNVPEVREIIDLLMYAAQVAGAGRDGERLDFCQKHGVDWDGMGGYFHSAGSHSGTNLRECIDSAMKADAARSQERT